MRVLIILILTALIGLGGLGLIAETETTAQPEPTPDIERCWTETGAPCDDAAAPAVSEGDSPGREAEFER